MSTLTPFDTCCKCGQGVLEGAQLQRCSRCKVAFYCVSQSCHSLLLSSLKCICRAKNAKPQLGSLINVSARLSHRRCVSLSPSLKSRVCASWVATIGLSSPNRRQCLPPILSGQRVLFLLCRRLSAFPSLSTGNSLKSPCPHATTATRIIKL
jgi:hypothetical protein